MSAESLSVELTISGPMFAPQEVLSQLLAQLAHSLGPDFLGHIKGIARFPDGVLYASTVGLPPEVTIQPYGQVPEAVSALDFELTCVGINLEPTGLRQAVEDMMAHVAEHHLIVGHFHDRTHQH